MKLGALNVLRLGALISLSKKKFIWSLVATICLCNNVVLMLHLCVLFVSVVSALQESPRSSVQVPPGQRDDDVPHEGELRSVPDSRYLLIQSMICTLCEPACVFCRFRRKRWLSCWWLGWSLWRRSTHASLSSRTRHAPCLTTPLLWWGREQNGDLGYD